MCKMFVYYFTILSYSLIFLYFTPEDWDSWQSGSCDLPLEAVKLEGNSFDLKQTYSL